MGWIFHRHCNEIKKRITEYSFDINFTWVSDPSQYHYDKYDLIYQLDPMSVPGPPPKHKTVIGLRNEFAYDHSTPGIVWFYKHYFEPRCVMFHVVNKNQYREFSSIPLAMPLLLVQHGIDTDCFKVKDKKEPSKDGPLVIGISGNRTSNGNKGFDLVEEACRITGCQLLTSQQNFSGGQLTKEQMSDYYNKIDIYCCMSKTEGLNNCVMEAGATAVPVITTKTGAVEEMVEDGKTGFIIERSVPALVDKLNFFKNNRDAIKVFGNGFANTIVPKWSWNMRIEDYRLMFNDFFKRNN